MLTTALSSSLVARTSVAGLIALLAGQLSLAQGSHKPQECPDLRGTYSCTFAEKTGEQVIEVFTLDQSSTEHGTLYTLTPNLGYEDLEANGLAQSGEEIFEESGLSFHTLWSRTLSCQDGKLITEMNYKDSIEGELIGFNRHHFSVQATDEGLYIEGISYWENPEGQKKLEKPFSEFCPRLKPSRF